MASEWAATTAYTVGHVVVPTTIGTRWYVCVSPGTSGGAEPTWTLVKGRKMLDGSVVWQCHGGDGGVGMLKFSYSTYEVTLTGDGLEVVWTYGNPHMQLTKRSGTKAGPRSMVAYIGEEILQITGILRGPGTPADIAAFKNIFKNRFSLGYITLTLTGDNATKFGTTLYVMHSGSNAIKVTPMKGTRYMHIVNIQVVRVDNA